MKRFRFLFSISVTLTFIFILLVSASFNAYARADQQDSQDVIAGARLFDNWIVVNNAGQTPTGDHPIWSRQTRNTQSGPETWRCVSCHGWDYQGKDGAFRSGAYATGFPGVLNAAGMDSADLVAAISGEKDAQHDFSGYLSNQEINQLTSFIQNGLINDNQYIDLVSRAVLSGELENGKSKYEANCQSCHGSDGTDLTFRYEGTQVALGTLAVQDPWRFLHRTRFGTARAPEMPVGGAIGWSAEDGRDVLFFVQSTFPTGFEAPQVEPAEIEDVENQGGPAQNWITGILTAFGAMATSLGFALLLGAALIGIILLLVWFLRNQKS